MTDVFKSKIMSREDSYKAVTPQHLESGENGSSIDRIVLKIIGGKKKRRRMIKTCFVSVHNGINTEDKLKCKECKTFFWTRNREYVCEELKHQESNAVHLSSWALELIKVEPPESPAKDSTSEKDNGSTEICDNKSQNERTYFSNPFSTLHHTNTTIVLPITSMVLPKVTCQECEICKTYVKYGWEMGDSVEKCQEYIRHLKEKYLLPDIIREEDVKKEILSPKKAECSHKPDETIFDKILNPLAVHRKKGRPNKLKAVNTNEILSGLENDIIRGIKTYDSGTKRKLEDTDFPDQDVALKFHEPVVKEDGEGFSETILGESAPQTISVNKSKKRTRYDANSKKILVNLIYGQKSILEPGKLQKVKREEKRNAWNKVAMEYNSIVQDDFKTVADLKVMYMCIKNSAKAKYASFAEKIQKTNATPSELFKRYLPEDQMIFLLLSNSVGKGSEKKGALENILKNYEHNYSIEERDLQHRADKTEKNVKDLHFPSSEEEIEKSRENSSDDTEKILEESGEEKNLSRSVEKNLEESGEEEKNLSRSVEKHLRIFDENTSDEEDSLDEENIQNLQEDLKKYFQISNKMHQDGSDIGGDNNESTEEHTRDENKTDQDESFKDGKKNDKEIVQRNSDEDYEENIEDNRLEKTEEKCTEKKEEDLENLMENIEKNLEELFYGRGERNVEDDERTIIFEDEDKRSENGEKILLDSKDFSFSSLKDAEAIAVFEETKEFIKKCGESLESNKDGSKCLENSLAGNVIDSNEKLNEENRLNEGEGILEKNTGSLQENSSNTEKHFNEEHLVKSLKDILENDHGMDLKNLYQLYEEKYRSKNIEKSKEDLSENQNGSDLNDAQPERELIHKNGEEIKEKNLEKSNEEDLVIENEERFQKNIENHDEENLYPEESLLKAKEQEIKENSSSLEMNEENLECPEAITEVDDEEFVEENSENYEEEKVLEHEEKISENEENVETVNPATNLLDKLGGIILPEPYYAYSKKYRPKYFNKPDEKNAMIENIGDKDSESLEKVSRVETNEEHTDKPQESLEKVLMDETYEENTDKAHESLNKVFRDEKYEEKVDKAPEFLENGFIDDTYKESLENDEEKSPEFEELSDIDDEENVKENLERYLEEDNTGALDEELSSELDLQEYLEKLNEEFLTNKRQSEEHLQENLQVQLTQEDLGKAREVYSEEYVEESFGKASGNVDEELSEHDEKISDKDGNFEVNLGTNLEKANETNKEEVEKHLDKLSEDDEILKNHHDSGNNKENLGYLEKNLDGGKTYRSDEGITGNDDEENSEYLNRENLKRKLEKDYGLNISELYKIFKLKKLCSETDQADPEEKSTNKSDDEKLRSMRTTSPGTNKEESKKEVLVITLSDTEDNFEESFDAPGSDYKATDVNFPVKVIKTEKCEEINFHKNIEEKSTRTFGQTIQRAEKSVQTPDDSWENELQYHEELFQKDNKRTRDGEMGLNDKETFTNSQINLAKCPQKCQQKLIQDVRDQISNNWERDNDKKNLSGGESSRNSKKNLAYSRRSFEDKSFKKGNNFEENLQEKPSEMLKNIYGNDLTKELYRLYSKNCRPSKKSSIVDSAEKSSGNDLKENTSGKKIYNERLRKFLEWGKSSESVKLYINRKQRSTRRDQQQLNDYSKGKPTSAAFESGNIYQEREDAVANRRDEESANSPPKIRTITTTFESENRASEREDADSDYAPPKVRTITATSVDEEKGKFKDIKTTGVIPKSGNTISEREDTAAKRTDTGFADSAFKISKTNLTSESENEEFDYSPRTIAATFAKGKRGTFKDVTATGITPKRGIRISETEDIVGKRRDAGFAYSAPKIRKITSTFDSENTVAESEDAESDYSPQKVCTTTTFSVNEKRGISKVVTSTKIIPERGNIILEKVDVDAKRRDVGFANSPSKIRKITSTYESKNAESDCSLPKRHSTIPATFADGNRGRLKDVTATGTIPKSGNTILRKEATVAKRRHAGFTNSPPKIRKFISTFKDINTVVECENAKSDYSPPKIRRGGLGKIMQEYRRCSPPPPLINKLTNTPVMPTFLQGKANISSPACRDIKNQKKMPMEIPELKHRSVESSDASSSDEEETLPFLVSNKAKTSSPASSDVEDENLDAVPMEISDLEYTSSEESSEVSSSDNEETSPFFISGKRSSNKEFGFRKSKTQAKSYQTSRTRYGVTLKRFATQKNGKANSDKSTITKSTPTALAGGTGDAETTATAITKKARSATYASIVQHLAANTAMYKSQTDKKFSLSSASSTPLKSSSCRSKTVQVQLQPTVRHTASSSATYKTQIANQVRVSSASSTSLHSLSCRPTIVQVKPQPIVLAKTSTYQTQTADQVLLNLAASTSLQSSNYKPAIDMVQPQPATQHTLAGTATYQTQTDNKVVLSSASSTSLHSPSFRATMVQVEPQPTIQHTVASTATYRTQIANQVLLSSASLMSVHSMNLKPTIGQIKFQLTAQHTAAIAAIYQTQTANLISVLSAASTSAYSTYCKSTVIQTEPHKAVQHSAQSIAIHQTEAVNPVSLSPASLMSACSTESAPTVTQIQPQLSVQCAAASNFLSLTSSTSVNSMNSKPESPPGQPESAAKPTMTATTFWRAPREDGKLPPTPRPFFCDVCIVDCSGSLSYRFHLKGQQHQKKVAAAKQQRFKSPSFLNQLVCKLCGVTCSGTEAYDSHIRGAKHQRVYKLYISLGKPIPTLDPIVVKNTATPDLIKEGKSKSTKTDKSEILGLRYIKKGINKNGIHVFNCELCECECTDVNGVEMHAKGRRSTR